MLYISHVIFLMNLCPHESIFQHFVSPDVWGPGAWKFMELVCPWGTKFEEDETIPPLPIDDCESRVENWVGKCDDAEIQKARFLNYKHLWQLQWNRKDKAMAYIRLLMFLLPGETCRENFRKNVQIFPPIVGEDKGKWLFDVHNIVNSNVHPTVKLDINVAKQSWGFEDKGKFLIDNRKRLFEGDVETFSELQKLYDVFAFRSSVSYLNNSSVLGIYWNHIDATQIHLDRTMLSTPEDSTDFFTECCTHRCTSRRGDTIFDILDAAKTFQFAQADTPLSQANLQKSLLAIVPSAQRLKIRRVVDHGPNLLTFVEFQGKIHAFAFSAVHDEVVKFGEFSKPFSVDVSNQTFVLVKDNVKTIKVDTLFGTLDRTRLMLKWNGKPFVEAQGYTFPRKSERITNLVSITHIQITKDQLVLHLVRTKFDTKDAAEFVNIDLHPFMERGLSFHLLETNHSPGVLIHDEAFNTFVWCSCDLFCPQEVSSVESSRRFADRLEAVINRIDASRREVVALFSSQMNARDAKAVYRCALAKRMDFSFHARMLGDTPCVSNFTNDQVRNNNLTLGVDVK